MIEPHFNPCDRRLRNRFAAEPVPASQMSHTMPALPPKPQPPQDYDCCGGGCADCELKIYLRELARWQKLVAQAGPDRPPD